jgi:vacuolar-type H+-ATPase subunit I/STV1
MASSGNPSGGRVRRVAILGRVVHLGRGRRAQDAAPQASDAGHERRIEVLEERIDQLEALLEGLQDAVHRESVREGERIGALEKRTEPSEISRALNRDARERGL